MLVLSRHADEDIVIGGGITIKVIDIRGDRVRLGIEAPRGIPVHRGEIQAVVDAAQQTGPDRGNAKEDVDAL